MTMVIAAILRAGSDESDGLAPDNPHGRMRPRTRL